MSKVPQHPNIFLHFIEKALDIYFAILPRSKPNPKFVQKTYLIAHRGAHDKKLGIIENTHAAFRHALELGCYGIEFDIHATKDDVLIVNHDPTLKRLWGVNTSINTTSFDDIRKSTPNIPSLEEVVAIYGKKLHLYIELKSPFNKIETLIQVLKPLIPTQDYHLISLDEEILPKLHMFPKESLLLVPTHNNVKKFCNISLQENYGGVLGHYLLFHNKLVKKLIAAKQLAGVGFVDSKNSLYRELNRGLNFLFTNKAKTVMAALNKLNLNAK